MCHVDSEKHGGLLIARACVATLAHTGGNNALTFIGAFLLTTLCPVFLIGPYSYLLLLSCCASTTAVSHQENVQLSYTGMHRVAYY